MNRNKIVLLVLLLFYLVVGIMSCRKKQVPENTFGWMLGKWKLQKIANEGTPGAALTYSPIQKEQDWEWTFNDNSTATEFNNYDGVPNIFISYNWKIVGGDSLWMGTSGAGHDTTTYYIATVNSSSLTLTFMDSTSTGNYAAQGFYFVKE